MTIEKSKNKTEYIKRVNQVLDYLDNHYAEQVDLASLAKVANFSPYHFHRIFAAIVGETINKYVQRIRLEKAAAQLSYKQNKSITAIALDCGFNSSAAFARVFKIHFGTSASDWRTLAVEQFSKNGKAERKIGNDDSKQWQASSLMTQYIDSSTNTLSWRMTMLNKQNVIIDVKQLPQTHVAYIRHIGEFKGETSTWASLFNRLMTWGNARGLVKCPGTQFYTVFRDDLMITDYSKFKADACISLDSPVKPDGEIGVSTIPAGAYAVASFEIDADEYEQAWQIVYRDWLPDSGFQPDDRCCFERYLNDPNQHPQKKHLIEVCIPVKPI